jgi:SAM-dependent methyltransferase
LPRTGMPISDVLQKRGVEIGGPSPDVFGAGGVFPLYPRISSLDNVNFSSKTRWEGSIQEGKTFIFDPSREPGCQYIREATALVDILPASYDFLLSSHTLEHTANPILALREWLRVLTSDGVIILVLPHKEGTFDWRRPTTTLDHLKDDFERGIDEHDLTHLPEILELHDLSRDLLAGDFANFKARSLKNFENRCLHHHTFTTLSAAALLDHVGVKIISVQAFGPHNIVIVAQKGQNADNAHFLNPSSPCYQRSPFLLDRNGKAGNFSADRSRPIGRNERCPCGSGKKFKHCHARLQ